MPKLALQNRRLSVLCHPSPGATQGKPMERRKNVMRNYELMVILRPELSDEERNAQLESIQQLVGSLKGDRKSTRLNSSHVKISYAVFCFKKKLTVSDSRV